MLKLHDPTLMHNLCYIDGAWQGAETQRAITAAGRAFPAWSKRTAKERAQICTAGTSY